MPGPPIGLAFERECRHESPDCVGRPCVSDVGGLPRLQRDPVCADRRAWRGVADRSDAGPTGIFRRLHGEDGRLREELFSGLHARRRVRQGHRAVGLFQVDRIRRHRRARPRARRAVHRRGLRDPDLWRRVAVRRGVRGLSVRGGDVPPGRHSQAADSLHDRARRLQLHDGCLAGNAANPEHHSDDVLQYHDLGGPGARADRQRFCYRRWPCLHREPPPCGSKGRGRLWHGASQRTGALRRGETGESLDRRLAAGGGRRGQLRVDPAGARGLTAPSTKPCSAAIRS